MEKIYIARVYGCVLVQAEGRIDDQAFDSQEADACPVAFQCHVLVDIRNHWRSGSCAECQMVLILDTADLHRFLSFLKMKTVRESTRISFA